MAQGILDTNTLILLGLITDPNAPLSEPLITSITPAELSVGPPVATSDEERAARQSHNPYDFSDIGGLTVIAVAHPDTSIR